MIADEILKNLKNLPGKQKMFGHLRESLSNAVVVRIQNVLDYYFTGTDQEYWEEEDFPNCAPPWPVFWMEWKQPPFSITKDLSAVDEKTLGMGITVETIGGGRYKVTYPPRLQESFGVLITGSRVPEDTGLAAKWLITMRLFSSWREKPYLGVARLWIDANGQLTVDEELARTLDKLSALEGVMLGSRDPGTMKKWGTIALAANTSLDLPTALKLAGFLESRVRNPSLLAISFCHCKNVILRPQWVPEKLRRKREESKTKAQVFHHYVMEIQPMRKILETQAPGQNLQKALSICRGHFADYREGRGLFGRHHGMYWFDMHVKGSRDQGEVRKDYEISP